MKFLKIFKNRGKTEHSNSWQWRRPLCSDPKTLSFRAYAAAGDVIFTTVNSVYDSGVDTPESWFTTTSSESIETLSTAESDDERINGIIVTGVKSDRLFFDPSSAAISPENQENQENRGNQEDQENRGIEAPFGESVMMAVESEDPYLDFKKSMEEIVEINGIKDWESLEELLEWYLKMNNAANHGFIIAAFVDLIIQFTTSSSSLSPFSSDSDNICHHRLFNCSSDVVGGDNTSYSSVVSSLSCLDLKEIEEEQG